MNQMLPRPQFWVQTAIENKTRFRMPGELLILMLLHLISSIASSLLLAIPISAWLMGTQGAAILNALNAGASVQSAVTELLEQLPDWMVLASLFAAAMMGVAAVVYCRGFQKRTLRSMGLRKGGAGEYLLGLTVGLVLFGAVILLGTVTGGFRLAATRPDSRQALLCMVALAGCAVRGAALELLFRGYFAPTIGARSPVFMALLLSTLLSAMLQAGGSLFSVTGMNALLLALFLGIWVLKRGCLWSSCAIQAAWSFAGSYLFQFAPAGEHAGIRLLDMEIAPYRSVLTGGDNGPQGSICTTLVLLASVGLALALRAKDPAPNEPSQPKQA